MKKFIVHIERTRKVMLDIEIEAATEQEAGKRIMEGVEAGAYETYFSSCEDEEGTSYEIDWIEEDEGENARWESLVIASLAGLLDCTYQDAQDIAEAQDFYMTQSWAKGLNAEQTARIIEEKSKA